MFIAVGIILFVFVVYCFLVYNKAIQLRNYVREAFATMDVYLKKRWDLVPNLVETVKSYANYEKSTFEKITKLRNKNYDSMTDLEKMQSGSQLAVMIPSIIALAENYPDLKASQNFIKLMDDLANIEDDIANSRKYYNGSVRVYNTFLEVFPSNILCKFWGFSTCKLFEIANVEKNNVKIEL